MAEVRWEVVRTQLDIEALMDRFGGFHDSCLREAHLWTGHYVDPDLMMACPGSLDTSIRMLFQRQYRNPSAIEMLFEEVTGLHLAPAPENQDNIIFDAALELQPDGTVYWSEWVGGPKCSSEQTWITARKLSWRDASEWMGRELRYGPGLPDGQDS